MPDCASDSEFRLARTGHYACAAQSQFLFFYFSQYEPNQAHPPLSPNATKVKLLGSGELGKEIIISLQRLGVEVIAVDHYESAPDQNQKHRHGARIGQSYDRQSKTCHSVVATNFSLTNRL